MNPLIIQQLKNFCYDYQDYVCEPFHGFRTHNPHSKDEFLLFHLPSHILIKNGIISLESFYYDSSKYVVFIIDVDHHIDEIVEVLKKIEEKPHISYLLFDPEEDIEFFMKDLWNVIVLVNQHSKNKIVSNTIQ
jgi:hypothetical protein